MRRKDDESLEFIVKHKEYFDQKLIHMITELNTSLKNSNEEKMKAIIENHSDKYINIMTYDLSFK